MEELSTFLVLLQIFSMFQALISPITRYDSLFFNLMKKATGYAGGAIYSLFQNLNFYDTTFFNNSALMGGAIGLDLGGLYIQGSFFQCKTCTFVHKLICKPMLDLMEECFYQIISAISLSLTAISKATMELQVAL